MLNLPPSLNRKAIRQAFPKISENTWDNLFDYEKNNGLHELRVSGPDKYPYYDLERLIQWLVQRGLYRKMDFYDYGEIYFEPKQVMQVRRHLIAG